MLKKFNLPFQILLYSSLCPGSAVCFLENQITEASKTKLRVVRLIKYQFLVFKKKKKKRQEREREQWIKSVPNVNLNVTNNTVVSNIGLQILIP